MGGRQELELFDQQAYDRAQELGIDITLETEYVWIGHEFSRAGVPKPWSEYSDDHGQIFYYDHESGGSQWIHPLIDTFKQLLKKCKEESHLMPYYKVLYMNLRQYCDAKKGWWALTMLLTPSDSLPPTPEEVRDMALYLKMSLKKEAELIWIAKQAVQVPLPPNWEEHESSQQVYFYDRSNGKSQLKHPLDDYFFALVEEERRKIPDRRKNTPNDKAVGWLPFTADTGRTYYVSFQHNVQTYYPPWEMKFYKAAAKIQRWVRKKQGYTQMLHRMAARIQAAYRGHVVRDAVAAWKSECAALCIQTMWRMYKARVEALMERSALTIQSCWRMHLCKKEFRRMLAALRLQCAWRCHLARRRLRREMAAQRIQARWRGVSTRKWTKPALVERHAAVTIQRRQRGIAGRQLARTMRREKAATLIQSHIRRHMAKQVVHAERYRQKCVTATLKIQSHWRRVLGVGLAWRRRRELLAEHAAVCIQRCYRGMAARQTVTMIKKMIAATNIQRGWRQYMGRVGPRRNKAATDIQRHWRGYKGRGWVHFMQNQEWYQINQAAVKIQSLWRGYRSRRRAALTGAAISVQRRVKGGIMRRRYVQHKSAIQIQKVWRGFVQRRAWLRWLHYIRYLACRLQYIFRSFVAQRKVRVEAMMWHYRNLMATRIQLHWNGHSAKKLLKFTLHVLKARRAAATCIQTRLRGLLARRRRAFLQQAYLMIQSNCRRVLAQRKLAALKLLAKKRKRLLGHLRPLYEALFVLPSVSAGTKREKHFNKFILKDLFKAGEDQMCPAALDRLDQQVVTLCDRCEARAAQRATKLQSFKVAWRLFEVPAGETLSVLEEGEAGWISDSVMGEIASEDARLTALMMFDLLASVCKAKAALLSMWDECAACPAWRRQNKALHVDKAGVGQSLDLLHKLLEELGRMETVRVWVAAALAPLLRRRAELKEKALALPTASALILDRAQGSLQRRKQAEATRALVELEAPRNCRQLVAAIADLERQVEELPVSLAMLRRITGYPDPQELRDEMAEHAARQEKKDAGKKRVQGAMVRQASDKIMQDINQPGWGGRGAAPDKREEAASALTGAKKKLTQQVLPESSSGSRLVALPDSDDDEDDGGAEGSAVKKKERKRPIRKKKKKAKEDG